MNKENTCKHQHKSKNGDIMCDAPGTADYLEYEICADKIHANTCPKSKNKIADQ